MSIQKTQYIVRAKYPRMGIWLFLAKDTWGRKGEKGSVYYWSNNMAIETCCFDSPEEALKKLNRLKIKNDHGDAEVSTFQDGIQIAYLNK